MRGTDIDPTGRARTGRILPGIAADRAFVDAMRGRRDNPVAQTIGRPDRPCREIRLRNGAGNKDSVRYRDGLNDLHAATTRSEEHTSELQSLMRISYAVFCLKKKKQ